MKEKKSVLSLTDELSDGNLIHRSPAVVLPKDLPEEQEKELVQAYREVNGVRTLRGYGELTKYLQVFFNGSTI